MQMPMQVSLDQLLPILMGNVQHLSMESNQMRDNFNIMFRVLYKKGIFTEEDVFEAIKEWYNQMYQLKQIEKMPDEETLTALKDELMMWIKGDIETIKERMKEFEEKMKEMAAKHNKKIDVASADVLNALKNSDPKKLII